MDFWKPFFPETPEVECNSSANGRHPVIRIMLHVEAVLEKVKTGGYSQVTLKESLVASEVKNRIGSKIVRQRHDKLTEDLEKITKAHKVFVEGTANRVSFARPLSRITGTARNVAKLGL